MYQGPEMHHFLPSLLRRILSVYLPSSSRLLILKEARKWKEILDGTETVPAIISTVFSSPIGFYSTTYFSYFLNSTVIVNVL